MYMALIIGEDRDEESVQVRPILLSPPTRYTPLSLAASDNTWVDSPGIFSAYSGKKPVP